MNLVRKIKISKLIDIEFTEDEMDMMIYIDSIFYDLTIFKKDGIDYYFLGKEDWIFFHYINTNVVFLNGDIFSYVRDKYSMNYSETKNILTYFLSNKFNLKIDNMLGGSSQDVYRVMKEYKAL